MFGILQLQVKSAAMRVIMRVNSAGELISWPSPCGVNCSYIFSFIGPAYQCVGLGPWPSPLNQVNITELYDLNPEQLTGPSALDASVLYLGVDDQGNGSSPISIWRFYNSFNDSMRCTLYNATYTTNVSYVNNIQYIQNDLQLLDSISLISLNGFDGVDPYEPGQMVSQSQNLWVLH